MTAWPCRSTGRLVVTRTERKLHLLVDPAIVDYARSLRPPGTPLNRTRFDPHITVVRDEAVGPRLWGAVSPTLEGREVDFAYDPRVVVGEVYWWLRAWSDELVVIRHALGLPPLSRLCRPPDGDGCFHITVGNTKGMAEFP